MTDDDAGGTLYSRGPQGDRSLDAVVDRLQIPLEHAMLTQRAVRRVLPDPVDDAIVLRCIELALRARPARTGRTGSSSWSRTPT